MASRPGLDRGQILTAALAIVDAEGPGALSLGRIAAQLGVRVPSLYHYLDGLDGLHSALALSALSELHQRLIEAAVGRSGRTAVVAVAHAYREFARQFPGRYHFCLRAPAPEDHEVRAVSEALVAVLRAALSAYPLDEAATLHAIRGLRALCHGFVSLELLDGFGLPYDRDESYRRLVNTFVDGLDATATGA